MISLDTIKFEVPADAILNMDIDKLYRKTDAKDSKEIYYNTNISHGFNYVEYRPKTETAVFRLSAKILGTNYYHGITLSTIEQAFDVVNSAGIIQVDKSKLDNMVLHAADFTKNLKLSYLPAETIAALRTITNDHYKIDDYKTKGVNKYTGLVYRGKQSSFKERLIIYDKHTELQANDEFLRSLGNGAAMLKSFKDVVRVENNVLSHKKIREYAKAQNNLLQVLSSNCTPEYKLFDKIRKTNYTQMDLFNNDDALKLYELEKRIGRETIIAKCNYDIDVVRLFLRSRLTAKNISRYVREYTELLTQMKQRDHSQVNKVLTIINEFENKLKVA